MTDTSGQTAGLLPDNDLPGDLREIAGWFRDNQIDGKHDPDDAYARIIDKSADALERKDARIAELELEVSAHRAMIKNLRTVQLEARDARIAELEAALERAAEAIEDEISTTQDDHCPPAVEVMARCAAIVRRAALSASGGNGK